MSLFQLSGCSRLFPCDVTATIHSFFLGTKSEDRTMMFPDECGKTVCGSLFSQRGKKVTTGLPQPKVRV